MSIVYVKQWTQIKNFTLLFVIHSFLCEFRHVYEWQQLLIRHTDAVLSDRDILMWVTYSDRSITWHGSAACVGFRHTHRTECCYGTLSRPLQCRQHTRQVCSVGCTQAQLHPYAPHISWRQSTLAVTFRMGALHYGDCSPLPPVTSRYVCPYVFLSGSETFRFVLLIPSRSWSSQRTFSFNPLIPRLVWIIFKNSVRTAKKTQHFTITKINWLTLFKEIIAVYTENLTKYTMKLLIFKAGGTNSSHSALKGSTNNLEIPLDGLTCESSLSPRDLSIWCLNLYSLLLIKTLHNLRSSPNGIK
jgi:hypothetical protein